MSEAQRFGMWPGVPARALTAAGRSFDELHVDGTRVRAVELRPSEGRAVLVDVLGDRDLTPPGASVGASVHEYGGAALTLHDGTAWFVDRRDDQIHVLAPDGTTRQLTPPDGRRYADPQLDHTRGRLVAVCEDHRSSDLRPQNSLVTVPLAGGSPEPLVTGTDFVVNPRVSPDGRWLAWCAWNLPSMPWDRAAVYVAPLERDGAIGAATPVAGGETSSAGHPLWTPDGLLLFIDDPDGWWNLFGWRDGVVEPVLTLPGEVGMPLLSPPQYDADETTVVAAVLEGGRHRLLTVERRSGVVAEIGIGSLTALSSPRLHDDNVVAVGGSATAPMSVWSFGSDGPQLLRGVGEFHVDAAFLGEPEELTFATTEGAQAHALYYPPRSPHATAPAGDRPPLVVYAHGGPVSPNTSALALGMYSLAAPVFWTSRGYAVVSVSYRGTTGYGRAYREALYGRWGVADVEDCVAAARFLVDRGDVDPARVAIRGGSAGGFTVLAALTQTDVFAAGTAYFPVVDLVAFHAQTHKYESGYDEQLVGGWEDERDRYVDRSPLTHVDRIAAPVLLVQGLDDRVCVPEQAVAMVEALRARGRPVEYLPIPDEGHGFLRAASNELALETERAFLERALLG